MPYQSKSQRRLFYAKARRGEIPWSTVEEWEKATKKKKLPERKKMRDTKRRAGKPRTEAERRARHKRLYGKDSKVPKRGAGLRRQPR